MNNDIKQEPFGYFRAEPFGWTDCAETDEGAIALYERPHPAPDVAAVQAVIQHERDCMEAAKARIAELERVQEYERWLLKRILDALPQNRDWLDPAIERAALAAVQKPEGGA